MYRAIVGAFGSFIIAIAVSSCLRVGVVLVKEDRVEICRCRIAVGLGGNEQPSSAGLSLLRWFNTREEVFVVVFMF